MASKTAQNFQNTPIEEMKPNNKYLKEPFKSPSSIIISVLRHSPIYTSLTKTTTTVPQRYLYYLWQTIKLERPKEKQRVKLLSFSTGERRYHFSCAHLRDILELPQVGSVTDANNQPRTTFDPVPPIADMISVLREIGYNTTLPKIVGNFKLNHLSRRWCVLYTILTKCLTGAATGLDSLHQTVLTFMHGLINNRHYDYADILWGDIKRVVAAHRRPTYIPFVRFFTLILEYIINKYNLPIQKYEKMVPLKSIGHVKTWGVFIPSLRIPDHLLLPIPETDPTLIFYRSHPDKLEQPDELVQPQVSPPRTVKKLGSRKRKNNERSSSEVAPGQCKTTQTKSPIKLESKKLQKKSSETKGRGKMLIISDDSDNDDPPTHDPPFFDSYEHSLPPTAQTTLSPLLPPVAPSCLPQIDPDKLPPYFQIHVPGPPILAEVAENAPPNIDSSQKSPPSTAQSLPQVAPSVLPAKSLSHPQTGSVELPVSSPQCGTICVGGYKVKRSVAPILESIFKKHGDIAAECLCKSASARSYFLEAVCEAVLQIETDDVIEKMEEINCQVSDAEANNINVSWLRAHLEAVHKRKEAMKRSGLLMETKVNTSLVKRAAQMDLRERCEELVAAQERFEKAERCARVLHLVENNLKNAILESKAENSLLSKDRIL